MPGISKEKAIKIHKLLQKLKTKDVAKMYNVSIATIERYGRTGEFLLNGSKRKKKTMSIPDTYPKKKEKMTKTPKDKLLDKLGAKFSDADLTQLLTLKQGQPPITETQVSFSGKEVVFLALGDTHIGSTHFEDTKLLSAFGEAKRQGAQFMIHTGDMLEGMSTRPGQLYELGDVGYTAQLDHTEKVFASWGKPVYFIAGNHDAWCNTKSGTGFDIGRAIEAKIPKSRFLGYHEGSLVVNGAKFLLWHGEDSSSYAVSYRPQKIVEAFTGGEKPQALFTGHVHKMLYLFDRNIHVLSTGCIEKQSGFMRYKRIAAHVGFWIVRAVIKDGEIKSFTPTWYPYYV